MISLQPSDISGQRIEIEGLRGEKEQASEQLLQLRENLAASEKQLEALRQKEDSRTEQTMTANVSAAREAALLSRNLALQEKCSELEEAKKGAP